VARDADRDERMSKVVHVAEVGKSQCGSVIDRLNELERTVPDI
jgi:hypothetical protein